MAGRWCVWWERGDRWRYRRPVYIREPEDSAGWVVAGWSTGCTPLHYNLPSLVRAEPGSPGIVRVWSYSLNTTPDNSSQIVSRYHSASLLVLGQHVDISLW